MRIDKFISDHTTLARSAARDAIRSGRVAVNGARASDPAAHIDPSLDVIALDGAPVAYQRHIHVLLNKPAGVITASSDRNARTVLDLIPDTLRRRDLAPVGRLDKDTTGVLLLTTDGQLGHRLIAPKSHVDKEYVADVDGVLGQSDIDAFANGIALSDFTALPAQLIIEAPNRARITVCEGKYHQIKRMLGSLGKPVVKLERVRFGPLTLGDLRVGECRALSPDEVAALYENCDAGNE